MPVNIFALDASGPCASAALLMEGVIRAETFLNCGLNHSVTLMPMIEAALKRCGATVGDMDAIACVVGPGSFTGVRIGVSTARALSFATGVPCIAIDALEALALSVARCGGPILICPILDARRDNVYAAAFLSDNGGVKRVMDDAALGVEEYLDAVLYYNVPLVFMGDGIAAYRDIITLKCGGRASFMQPHLSSLRASSAAVLAADGTRSLLAHDELKPLYLRAPQAERTKEAQEGQCPS